MTPWSWTIDNFRMTPVSLSANRNQRVSAMISFACGQTGSPYTWAVPEDMSMVTTASVMLFKLFTEQELTRNLLMLFPMQHRPTEAPSSCTRILDCRNSGLAPGSQEILSFGKDLAVSTTWLSIWGRTRSLRQITVTPGSGLSITGVISLSTWYGPWRAKYDHQP